MINAPELKPYTQNQIGYVSTTQTTPQENTNIFETAKTAVTEWFNGDDMKCEDGANDGTLDAKEKWEHFGKGLLGIVKTAVKHPVKTGLALAGGIALAALSGPAISAAAFTIGAATSAITVGYGAYKAHTAKTDAEAKQAYELMGNGTFGLALSALNVKSAAKGAENAGLIADKVDDMNTLQAAGACIKATPQSLAQGAGNVFNNSRNIINPGIININGAKTLVNGDELQSMADGIKISVQNFDDTSPWQNTVSVRKAPTEYVTTAIKGSILGGKETAPLVDYLNQLDEVRVEDWGTFNRLADMKLGTWQNSAYISNAAGMGEATATIMSNSSAQANALSALTAYEIEALTEEK